MHGIVNPLRYTLRLTIVLEHTAATKPCRVRGAVRECRASDSGCVPCVAGVPQRTMIAQRRRSLRRTPPWHAAQQPDPQRGCPLLSRGASRPTVPILPLAVLVRACTYNPPCHGITGCVRSICSTGMYYRRAPSTSAKRPVSYYGSKRGISKRWPSTMNGEKHRSAQHGQKGTLTEPCYYNRWRCAGKMTRATIR